MVLLKHQVNKFTFRIEKRSILSKQFPYDVNIGKIDHKIHNVRTSTEVRTEHLIASCRFDLNKSIAFFIPFSNFKRQLVSYCFLTALGDRSNRCHSDDNV